MQISENLLRVIFMLSTIVVVTDCCSSRLLLLKEHTLQIVQQQRLQHSQSDDYDYEHDDYEQLQQQQHQQQQQQKIPHYVELAKSDIDYIKNYTDEHTRSKNKDGHEENSTEADIFSAAMQLGNFDSDSFESLLGIFDAAAYDTTTTTTATTTEMSTTSLSSAIPHSTTTRTTAATTIAQQSTSPENTTQRARTSVVVDEQQNVEASSTTMPTPASTTIASSLGDDMEKVMNDLKTVRDLLSLPCSGQFNTEFCLNRGRCFRYPIGNDTIHSCICADGYIGERCESKSMNGSFIPSIAGAGKKQKILMARIVFSFPMLVALSVIYIMVGAAIVFKRPVPPPHTMKERIELLPDDDAGELILLNSYPVVDQTVTYASFMD